MSISNRKPGEKKEAPAEPLKRSIAGTMKAIARKPDLEVAFAGMTGEVRCPSRTASQVTRRKRRRSR